MMKWYKTKVDGIVTGKKNDERVCLVGRVKQLEETGLIITLNEILDKTKWLIVMIDSEEHQGILYDTKAEAKEAAEKIFCD